MKKATAQPRATTMLAALILAASPLVDADAAPTEQQPLSTQVATPAPAPAGETAGHRPFAVQSPWMFGDWDGARTRLQQQGVDLTLHYTADLQRNVHGGAEVGNDFWGRLRAAAEFDMGKLASIPGARIFISGLEQSGGNANALTGAYTSVSSILGVNTTRLDEFYFEQTLADGNFMYRVGQVAGIDAFGMIDYGDYFLNLELGYAPKLEFVSNIPFGAGGQLGGFIRAGQAARGLYAKAGIFSGTPDTFNADKHGLDFKWNDTVLAGEVGYVWAHSDRPAQVRAGGHYNTNGTFNRWDGSGDAGNNYVLYGAYKQTLWQNETGPSGFDLALTAFTAPGNRNAADFQGLVSAIYRAPFPTRPDDAIAFGIIGSRMSKDFARSASIGRGTEMTYELSYTIKVSKWFLVQPDIQYIRNPMGNKSADAAWVAGVRLKAVF